MGVWGKDSEDEREGGEGTEGAERARRWRVGVWTMPGMLGDEGEDFRDDLRGLPLERRMIGWEKERLMSGRGELEVVEEINGELGKGMAGRDVSRDGGGSDIILGCRGWGTRFSSPSCTPGRGVVIFLLLIVASSESPSEEELPLVRRWNIFACVGVAALLVGSAPMPRGANAPAPFSAVKV